MTGVRDLAREAEDRAAPAPALPAHPARRLLPARLSVEVTTRCNLRCAMCVRESAGQAIRQGDLSPALFARLAPAFPTLEALVLNGIGEPLLHPELERMIATARRAMPDRGWVGFQTNGQLLDARRAEALAEAGVDRICLSADAVSPTLFRALRVGGRQEAIEEAAAALAAAARRRGRPIAVGVEFVAMRENLGQLPALVRWAAHRKLGFVIVTHMLPYAEATRRSAAFDTSTDRALDLFREARDRAAAEGVDFRRYFQVFLKWRPAAEDLRVIAAVRALVDRASREGVGLALDRLLRADEPLQRRVEATFEEAAAIARAEGIDLRLPASVPRRARRCTFVEGGAAFVSWDGELHPCYPLWHGYRCHAGGLAKEVRPWSHGGLAGADLAELWAGAPARAFREEVLRYQFPRCYDCSLALCDLARPAEFTEDCHVGAVPCGTCLWSAGLFQCLDAIE